MDRGREGFKPAVHPDALILPLRWRKPRMIFVNSMSDLFHEEIPLWFIREVFAVMREAHWHIFQVLTKRSGRLLEFAHEIKWPPNVWMGVSVETSKYLYRIDHLRKVPAALRFISFEPLLGPMPDMDLTGIDWIIVGGESGPGARPMKEEWVIGIRDQYA
jgi:protein gp37